MQINEPKIYVRCTPFTTEWIMSVIIFFGTIAVSCVVTGIDGAIGLCLRFYMNVIALSCFELLADGIANGGSALCSIQRMNARRMLIQIIIKWKRFSAVCPKPTSDSDHLRFSVWAQKIIIAQFARRLLLSRLSSTESPGALNTHMFLPVCNAFTFFSQIVLRILRAVTILTWAEVQRTVEKKRQKR